MSMRVECRDAEYGTSQLEPTVAQWETSLSSAGSLMSWGCGESLHVVSIATGCAATAHVLSVLSDITPEAAMSLEERMLRSGLTQSDIKDNEVDPEAAKNVMEHFSEVESVSQQDALAVLRAIDYKAQKINATEYLIDKFCMAVDLQSPGSRIAALQALLPVRDSCLSVAREYTQALRDIRSLALRNIVRELHVKDLAVVTRIVAELQRRVLSPAIEDAARLALISCGLQQGSCILQGAPTVDTVVAETMAANQDLDLDDSSFVQTTPSADSP